MAALTVARTRRPRPMKNIPLPLAAGAKATQGGMACIDVSAGSAKPGAAGNANLVRVGVWAETVDNSGGGTTAPALAELDHEIVGLWFDNATGGAAVSALFADCYMLDDHTVTSTSSGNSKAGRVWAIDAVKGVLVESFTL
jgi:hypothetical protein